MSAITGSLINHIPDLRRCSRKVQEAARRRGPVVLVTDDRKEDWVRREHGLTLGPRPELCEEMSAAGGTPFLLMSTATFLRHAKEYLSVDVSPETVDQARELPSALTESERMLIEETRVELEAIRALRRRTEEDRRDAIADADRYRKLELNGVTSEAEVQEIRSRHRRTFENLQVIESRLGMLAEEERYIEERLTALVRKQRIRSDGTPLELGYY
jgi:hypothetical protein